MRPTRVGLHDTGSTRGRRNERVGGTNGSKQWICLKGFTTLDSLLSCTQASLHKREQAWSDQGQSENTVTRVIQTEPGTPNDTEPVGRV